MIKRIGYVYSKEEKSKKRHGSNFQYLKDCHKEDYACLFPMASEVTNNIDGIFTEGDPNSK